MNEVILFSDYDGILNSLGNGVKYYFRMSSFFIDIDIVWKWVDHENNNWNDTYNIWSVQKSFGKKCKQNKNVFFFLLATNIFRSKTKMESRKKNV